MGSWIMLVVRLVLIPLIPLSIFWALRTIVPAWDIPYTPSTVVAFWVLYVALRIGVQTIRYSEWDFSLMTTI